MKRNYLKSLDIRRYAYYKNSKIEFDKNINLFIGRNGAGKTFFLNKVLNPLLSSEFEKLDLTNGIDVSYSIVTVYDDVEYEIAYTVISEPMLLNSEEKRSFQIRVELIKGKELIFTYFRDNNQHQIQFHAFDLEEITIPVESVSLKNLSRLNFQQDLAVVYLNETKYKAVKDNSKNNFLTFFVQIIPRFSVPSINYQSAFYSYEGGRNALPGNFNFSIDYLKDFFTAEIQYMTQNTGFQIAEGFAPRPLFVEFFSHFFIQKLYNKDIFKDIDLEKIIHDVSESFCRIEHVDYFLSSGRFRRIKFQLLSGNVTELKEYDAPSFLFKMNLQILIEDRKGDVRPLFNALTEGESRFLSYCLMINLISKYYFLVDEIENGLHPEWISHIMNESSKQLFISTHNPFVLNNLLSLLESEDFTDSHSVHVCRSRDEKNSMFSVDEIDPKLKSHIALALKRETDFSKLLTKYKIW
ncbi:AAA family ATPase [Peredibacter sp. HCB2-198]|uniref:AAA family ATPase n=1 Tax=Peredibacter sp. HCB2-198 TaxID=3383025 RepID=UPI0038B66071